MNPFRLRYERHYKPGEEQHDTLAWEGGNVPDSKIVSTLGVQLVIAHSELLHAILAANRLLPETGHLLEHLTRAGTAIDRAMEHYDNDKLSDIGAQIIE
jgi:hypothetical protein